MVPFWGFFLGVRLDLGRLLLPHIFLFLLGIYTVSDPIYRGWKWIFWTRIHIYYFGQVISNFLFFKSCSWPSSSSCNSFFDIYPFSISVMSFLFQDFASKLFCFFFIQLFISSYAFSTELGVEFSFVILEGLVAFVWLPLIPVSFKPPFWGGAIFFIYLFQLCCRNYLWLSFFGVFILICAREFYLP